MFSIESLVTGLLIQLWQDMAVRCTRLTRGKNTANNNNKCKKLNSLA